MRSGRAPTTCRRAPPGASGPPRSRSVVRRRCGSLGSLIASCFFSPITNRPSIWWECSAGRSAMESVKMDQGLESSDQVHKLARAPSALRILGGAALAWGTFLGLGMITAIVGTQSTYGDVDTVGTLADWTATVALVVVGRALLRSRWWAGIAAWATSVRLIVFGVYWPFGGTLTPGPGHSFQTPVTGAALPWPVFVVPGLAIAAMLLPRSSRAWIQQARREHRASSR
jgi:hypothetical protein